MDQCQLLVNPTSLLPLKPKLIKITLQHTNSWGNRMIFLRESKGVIDE